MPPGDLLTTSRKWALDIACGRKPFLRSLHRTDKIGSLSEARAILMKARQLAKRIAPNMPQHHACIEVIEDGIIHGGYSGVLKVNSLLTRKARLLDWGSFLVYYISELLDSLCRKQKFSSN